MHRQDWCPACAIFIAISFGILASRKKKKQTQKMQSKTRIYGCSKLHVDCWSYTDKVKLCVNLQLFMPTCNCYKYLQLYPKMTKVILRWDISLILKMKTTFTWSFFPASNFLNKNTLFGKKHCHTLRTRHPLLRTKAYIWIHELADALLLFNQPKISPFLLPCCT